MIPELDGGAKNPSRSTDIPSSPPTTYTPYTTLQQLVEWSGGKEVELLLEEQRRILVEREKLRQMQEFDDRERAMKMAVGVGVSIYLIII